MRPRMLKACDETTSLLERPHKEDLASRSEGGKYVKKVGRGATSDGAMPKMSAEEARATSLSPVLTSELSSTPRSPREAAKAEKRLTTGEAEVKLPPPPLHPNP